MKQQKEEEKENPIAMENKGGNNCCRLYLEYCYNEF